MQFGENIVSGLLWMIYVYDSINDETKVCYFECRWTQNEISSWRVPGRHKFAINYSFVSMYIKNDMSQTLL